MAGTKIEIDSNTDLVIAEVQQILNRTQDLRPAWRDIGEYLLKSTDDRFDAQKSPDGTPWAPLSEWYRETKPQNQDKILVLDGYLRGLNRYQVENNTFEFGTNRLYGAVHQFGAKQGEFGRSPRGNPIPWGDIPARPWLGLRPKTKSRSSTSSETTLVADNRFQSSWRPCIGYVCALALAGKFILHPALVWVAFFLDPSRSPPIIGSDGLMELVVGMLGLAGMRTIEKVKKGA